MSTKLNTMNHIKVAFIAGLLLLQDCVWHTEAQFIFNYKMMVLLPQPTLETTLATSARVQLSVSSSVIDDLWNHILLCFGPVNTAASITHDCPSLIQICLTLIEHEIPFFQGQWAVFAPGRPQQPGGGHGGCAGRHESVTQRWRQQKRQCMATSHIYIYMHACYLAVGDTCCALYL